MAERPGAGEGRNGISPLIGRRHACRLQSLLCDGVDSIGMLWDVSEVAAAERVPPVPLGGRLDRRSGIGPTASTSRPATAAPSRSRSSAGTVEALDRPRRAAPRQRPGGRRVRRARLVHLPGLGHDAGQALHRRDGLRPGRPGGADALELLLLADQGRLDPRALGRRQRPRRHHAARPATTSWSPPPAATSPRGRTSSCPAPTACSRPGRPRATTRPGSPTSTTT